MTTAPLRKRIVAAIHRSAPRHVRSTDIKATATLGDLGFSSLRLIGLIVALEDTCGLTAEALLSLSSDTTVDELTTICLASSQELEVAVDAERGRAA